MRITSTNTLLSLMFIVMMNATTLKSQSTVATFSGTSATLVASQGALSGGFESLFNDGTSVTSSSISVSYYAADSSFYLTGTGTYSGSICSVYTKLSRSGSNLILNQGSNGKGVRCWHPNCNYAPCSTPPVCTGSCNGVGSCEFIEVDFSPDGHMGSFY
jgi:hypothetical protein